MLLELKAHEHHQRSVGGRFLSLVNGDEIMVPSLF